MADSFTSWFGKPVTLQLTSGELRVPLSGIIVAETLATVRFRIPGGWEIDVYKSMIRAVEYQRPPLQKSITV